MQMDQSESSVVTGDAEPPQSLAQLRTEIVSAYVSRFGRMPHYPDGGPELHPAAAGRGARDWPWAAEEAGRTATGV